MSAGNSSEHWCKSTYNSVLPKAGLSASVPPPPIPPSAKRVSQSSLSVSTNAAATANAPSAAQKQMSPQMLQMYQKLYSTAPASAPPSAPAPSAGLSRSISTPWTASYGYAAVSTAVPPAAAPPPPPPAPPAIPSAYASYGAAINIQLKKPNKSRFTAPAIDASRPPPPPLPPQPSATAAGTAPQQASAQPPSLREFVKRAFSQCTTNEERSFISDALQRQIKRVTEEGRLHVHRWDLEPVPTYNAATVAGAAQSWLSVGSSYSNVVSSQVPALSASRGGAGVAGVAGGSKSTAVMGDYVSLNSSSRADNAAAAGDGKKRKSKWLGEDLHTDSIVSAENEKVGVKKKASSLAGLDKLDTPQERQMREHRANRFLFDEQQQLSTSRSGVDDASGFSSAAKASKATKKNKKSKGNVNKYGPGDSGGGGVEIDLDSLKITGTCQKLEKDYLRLTSAPHPSVVRPEAVLRKTIQLIKRKWAADEVDYVYMCSQLKSIRQDLTVQHIRNDFTVHVYETHGRVALECDDTNEYNQCQTQLKQLYESGLKGCEMEFTAYRVLYYVYLQSNKKYTGGSKDLAHLMNTLSAEALNDAAVAHALKVRQAVQLDNYHTFFRLYRDTPNMGCYLLDLMVENWRVQALIKMCKVYKPDVPANFIVRELGFEDSKSGYQFMQKVGCLLNEGSAPGTLIWSTKDSVIDPSALQAETKLLM